MITDYCSGYEEWQYDREGLVHTKFSWFIYVREEFNQIVCDKMKVASGIRLCCQVNPPNIVSCSNHRPSPMSSLKDVFICN